MTTRVVIVFALAFTCAINTSAEVLQASNVIVQFNTAHKALARESIEIIQRGISEYGDRLPPGQEPIRLYIASTIQEFSSLSGGPNMRSVQAFARSEQGIIVAKSRKLLQIGASYPAILRHELLHILLARNTSLEHLPRWLNEGIAMELSREERWMSLFRVARMYTQNHIIEYKVLPYVFAAPGSETRFGDAYAQSLSMTKLLRKQLGREAFWSLIAALKTKPFGQVLKEKSGQTPSEFFNKWRASLWKIAVISGLVSGFSLFQFAAILAIVGYFRKRHKGKKLMRQWAEEEREDDDVQIILPWELEGQDGPYPWEED